MWREKQPLFFQHDWGCDGSAGVTIRSNVALGSDFDEERPPTLKHDVPGATSTNKKLHFVCDGFKT